MKKEVVKRDIKSNVEVRSTEEGRKTITGFIPYNSRSEYMGYFVEYIAPTAFNKTLADGKNVRCLYNHDSSKVLGCVANGSLRFDNREDGLYMECDLPDTQYARDAYELIKNGYVDTMSFGFRIIEQDYGQDDAGIETHTLREVALEEVSAVVAWPAYKETKSEARSLENLLSKDELSDEEISQLREYRSSIDEKLQLREEPQEDLETKSAEMNLTDSEQEDHAFIENIRSQLKEIFGE